LKAFKNHFLIFTFTQGLDWSAWLDSGIMQKKAEATTTTITTTTITTTTTTTTKTITNETLGLILTHCLNQTTGQVDKAKKVLLLPWKQIFLI